MKPDDRREAARDQLTRERDAARAEAAARRESAARHRAAAEADSRSAAEHRRAAAEDVRAAREADRRGRAAAKALARVGADGTSRTRPRRRGPMSGLRAAVLGWVREAGTDGIASETLLERARAAGFEPAGGWRYPLNNVEDPLHYATAQGWPVERVGRRLWRWIGSTEART